MILNKVRFFLTLLLFSVFFKSFGQVPYNQTNFEAPMHIPLILSGNFAELRSNHFHSGLDIKTKGTEGYRIYAVDSGYISRINISHWGYGKAIYVDHPNGYTSVYAHLSRFPEKIEKYLRKKQFEQETETITIYLDSNDLRVDKGEIIAYSGNSGSSGGPHLHFEIRETKTEFPVNPLLFGFDVKDDIKPSVHAIKVYPQQNGFVSGDQAHRRFDVTGSDGNYRLTSPIEVLGKIGFGVHTVDKLNGAGNKCGIYTIELFNEDTLIFRQKMEKLNFSTTRYINAHMDYDEYKTYKRSIHKSFIDGNNQLALYDTLINNGIINFNKKGDYAMKYVIKDTYGNTSIVNFTVRCNPEMETIAFPASTAGDPITYEDEVAIEKDNFKAYLPNRSVYYDLRARYREGTASKAVSDLHRFGDAEIPVQEYFVMQIKTKGLSQEHQQKATIVEVSEDGRKVFSKGGEYKDGWIETKVRSFGKYMVKVDSVAPIVNPVGFSDGNKVTSSIRFNVSDNLSGIDDYDMYVDNKWMLSNYVPKRGTLTLTFDKYNTIQSGNHQLKVVVKDERGNQTVKEYDFVK